VGFNAKAAGQMIDCTASDLTIAPLRVYVRLDNFTTKPRFQSRNLYILPRTKSQSSKKEKNIHAQRARG